MYMYVCVCVTLYACLHMYIYSLKHCVSNRGAQFQVCNELEKTVGERMGGFK